jgi:hypothetical protein
VHKSQVFALSLIRRKPGKNSTDLIRCKFSIDAGFTMDFPCARRIHHFETILVRSGNPTFTICIEMNPLAACEKAEKITS